MLLYFMLYYIPRLSTTLVSRNSHSFLAVSLLDGWIRVYTAHNRYEMWNTNCHSSLSVLTSLSVNQSVELCALCRARVRLDSLEDLKTFLHYGLVSV